MAKKATTNRRPKARSATSGAASRPIGKTNKTAARSKAETTGKKKTAERTTSGTIKSKVATKRTNKSVKVGASESVGSARSTVKPAAKNNAKANKAASPNSKTRTASLSAVEEPTPRDLPTEAQLRRVKTGLSRKDLNHYRERLLKKRAEIIGDVTKMETDARNPNSGGNLSSMPMHMADIGSDNYEQEFTLGLVESERRLLRLIDEALMRLSNKTYGVCIETAKPIGRARLDAKPWAKYCIEVVREKERLGQL